MASAGSSFSGKFSTLASEGKLGRGYCFVAPFITAANPPAGRRGGGVFWRQNNKTQVGSGGLTALLAAFVKKFEIFEKRFQIVTLGGDNEHIIALREVGQLISTGERG